MPADTLTINRAPVFCLWAAVVAERLGYDRDSALSLGKVCAGLNAQAKGRALGIFETGPTHGGEPVKRSGLGEDFWVQLCGRPVPAKETDAGTRGVVKDKPVEPAAVEKYLQGKFGDALPDVRAAMEELAAAYDPATLAEAAYHLYEQFRPSISPGAAGWGQAGELRLATIRGLKPG